MFSRESFRPIPLSTQSLSAQSGLFRLVQVENRGRHGTCVAQALLALLLFVWPWLTSTAQVAYGSIAGRISDGSGAVVKGASVTLTDLGTDESRVPTDQC